MKEVDINRAIELCSPHPYTLVVTSDKQGKPNAMGVAWWTFTCLRPPMLAILIGRVRYTHENLDGCKEFVLCMPSEDQAVGAWVCGTQSGRRIDKFAETGLRTTPSKVVTPPLIVGATAAFECKVVGQMECGDHTLYNGEIVAIHGDPERAKHLYTIHYRKMVSIDYLGNVNWNMAERPR